MHDLLKIVGNSVSNVQIVFISLWHYLFLAHSGIGLWLVSISDEDSLSEIALSGASKLASTYFKLFYRSVHVLYTEICILGGCLC